MPKLTNRGAAGLLNKLPNVPEDAKRTELIKARDGKQNNISPSLKKVTIVDIDLLVPDPMNARLHPERNLEAIKQSLQEYGQMSPLTVKTKDNIVIKGNGTLQAARELGWTKIAVHFVDFSDIQAAGYGIADNRTSELADWNFEIVSRIDKLLLEAKHPTIGWSQDELDVLRQADWIPPDVDDEKEFNPDTPSSGSEGHIITFNEEEYKTINEAVAFFRKEKRATREETTESACLVGICVDWLANLLGE